jgi:hypothetical protein
MSVRVARKSSNRRAINLSRTLIECFKACRGKTRPVPDLTAAPLLKLAPPAWALVYVLFIPGLPLRRSALPW